LVEAATVRVASQGGQLTEAEMRALLAEAGAPAEWVPDMLTIAWCESHYSPGAVGDSGNSLGLFQLWSGWARPGEDLFDPLTNARVAVRVREIRGRFGGGGGWSCADLNGIS
jgi:plasmid stability protein